MPASAKRASVAGGGRSITTPRASSTSAAPHADDAALLPCLTIRAPAAAATIVAIVDTLTVCAPSAPLPTRSVIGPGMLIGVACASMPSARPDISSGVSPLARRPTPNPAIWAADAAPSMISFIAQAVWLALSGWPPMSARMSPGQVGRSTDGRATGAALPGADRRGAGPHQGGKLPGQRHRVDRVADHGVGPRPGREPAVVGPGDDQQHRRAVVYLVLGLAA